MKYRNFKKIIFNILVISGMLIGLFSGFANTNPALASETPKTTTLSHYDLPESATGLYIVQLSDPSISLYMGGISAQL